MKWIEEKIVVPLDRALAKIEAWWDASSDKQKIFAGMAFLIAIAFFAKVLSTLI